MNSKRSEPCKRVVAHGQITGTWLPQSARSGQLGFSSDNYRALFEETSYEGLEINGNKARLISEPNRLRVYLIFGEDDSARHFFGMGIPFNKAHGAKTARKIFQSIRFVKEN